MAKRYKMDRRRSERSFSKGASRLHRKNLIGSGAPMRGGIRL